MRTINWLLAISVGVLLGAPVLAQQTLLDQLQSQERTDSLTSSGAQRGVPGEPGASGLQDPRSSSTTITNRPLPGAGPRDPAGGSTVDLKRKLDEIQARQLLQQIQQLQTDQKERNEFQDFVLQSTGRDLQMFGSNLFRNVPSTFAPSDDVPVTADYVIGPGDEIRIRAWGQIDVDVSVFV